MFAVGLKTDGRRARMKVEGPVGRQHNPGDRCWCLGQGGNNGGGEKWKILDVLKRGGKRFPGHLDVECERERESTPGRSQVLRTESLAFQGQMLYPCLIPLPVPHREGPKGCE